MSAAKLLVEPRQPALGSASPRVLSSNLSHHAWRRSLDLYSHVLLSMQSEAVKAFDDPLQACDAVT
jgi:hypothetical protein